MSNILLQHNFFQQKTALIYARNISICLFLDHGMHFSFIISMLFLSGHTPLGRRGCFPTQEQTTQEFGALHYKWNRYCPALSGHIFWRRSSFLVKACFAEAPSSHTHEARVAKFLKARSFWVLICSANLAPAPGFEYCRYLAVGFLASAYKCHQISEICNVDEGQSCGTKHTSGKKLRNWVLGEQKCQEYSRYYQISIHPGFI